MDYLVESNLTMDQKRAVEIVASTPGISQRALSSEISRSLKTVNSWFQNPTFTDACFDRYRELSGVKLTAVIEAMFREASEGNVAAARLLLEHHNKLDRTIHLKVESPFDKFLNSRSLNDINVEEAEIIGNSIEIPSNLPPRNLDRINPDKVLRDDKKRLKGDDGSPKSVKRERRRRNTAYHLRRRANSVGLKLLPPGRHPHEVRKKWIKHLRRLEQQNGIVFDE
tara:strand:+ start:289 stop:963 length:675 start_codon:yes stop_codon:yes gene_type:complete